VAIAVIDLTTCENYVAGIVNARAEGNAWGPASATDQERFSPTDITTAVKVIDLEIRTTIVETVGHWARGEYLGASADLSDGAEMPFHIGRLGAVDVKLTSGTYVLGIECRNVDVYRKLKANPDGMYGDATENEGRYYLSEEHRVFIIGSKARVWTVAEAAIGGTLLSPINYTATVVRGACSILDKDGVDPSTGQKYSVLYEQDLARIRGDETVVPPLAAFQRAGG
jgi:hypothetical protein